MDEQKKTTIGIDGSFYDENCEEKKTVRVLCFSLGNEKYCVGIKQIKKALRVSQITKVPDVPGFIAGVTNFRGEILALCDTKYFLGLGQSEKTGQAEVIISDVTGEIAGMVVDKINGAMDIPEEDIQPPLSTLNTKLARYTRGQVRLGEDILIFLDLEKILNCEEMVSLRKGGAG
jgi:purine-binding chemotaxis protein CheW